MRALEVLWKLRFVKSSEGPNGDFKHMLSLAELISFIANGSVLPRETGVSEKPMKNTIYFKSPPSME